MTETHSASSNESHFFGIGYIPQYVYNQKISKVITIFTEYYGNEEEDSCSLRMEMPPRKLCASC